MGELLPVVGQASQVYAPEQKTITSNSLFSVRDGQIIYTGPRLRTFPRAVDPKLRPNDPKQTYDDCRTIEGWTDMISKLLKLAWGSDEDLEDFIFTHDFALIPNNPNEIKSVIIVYDVISEEPAQQGNHREKKPKIRQTNVNVTGPHQTVWGWQMDVMVAFTIYADSWTRLIKVTEKFKDFMQSYTGVFKGLGLQEMYFHSQMRDALYDPPHAQENPTRTVFYFVKTEKIYNINESEVTNILIQAGLIDPVTLQEDSPVVEASITGVPKSPELPHP